MAQLRSYSRKETWYLGDIERESGPFREKKRMPLLLLYEESIPRGLSQTVKAEHVYFQDEQGRTPAAFARHPIYSERFSLWTKKDGTYNRSHANKPVPDKPLEQLIDQDVLGLLQKPDVPAKIKRVLGIESVVEEKKNGANGTNGEAKVITPVLRPREGVAALRYH